MNTIDDLIGYLCGALDDDACRWLELQLELDAAWRDRLEVFSRALEPLEHDRLQEEPPACLAARTFAHLQAKRGDA
jgi:hypothetical protein